MLANIFKDIFLKKKRFGYSAPKEGGSHPDRHRRFPASSDFFGQGFALNHWRPFTAKCSSNIRRSTLLVEVEDFPSFRNLDQRIDT